MICNKGPKPESNLGCCDNNMWYVFYQVLLLLPVVVLDMDLINLFAVLLVYPSDQIPVLSRINSGDTFSWCNLLQEKK
ncbi:hypothetical protein MATL_G00257690 [Megalops atlanticus]|uniref:Uncharacterized protein n=1 Tax=Megalops atlanticus TaxID=7932 RepID=A0A9D3PAC9_MEGAT|nr:hypothetical protein MATL_G00257690 [Megalops atlanticus]